MFRYKCETCDEWHEGVPSFGASAPLYYFSIPEADREKRCTLASDFCVVDDEFFFIRGCIEIPVVGILEPYSWGAWVSLSRENFDEFISTRDELNWMEFGPYFGWLSAEFLVYPESENLKARVHVREPGRRPLIELEPTDHPLAVEQRIGITVERLGEIVAAYTQGLPTKH